MSEDEPSLLEQLDSAIPAPLAQFDAFPKVPSTYRSRSESRGFITIFAFFIAFLLVLNDIGEFVWGWPDYEFSVDRDTNNLLNVNVDMVVNMPCQYLSVDLRDAVGDRLYLSGMLHRDGTFFDVGQATKLKAHSQALSASQAVAQSRKSRGFFSTLFRRTASIVRPTYNHKSHTSACRISGSVLVKKVTANLHITTLGHGYSSWEHVDHKYMNLSHVIEEFSFGPYFPEMTQPLDYSYETTHDPFVAYQYFLHIVPTTYIVPRSLPLHTNQYSVTHYTRTLDHHSGTPGIFFKFDLDPMSLTIHQRTTSFYQLLIRSIGVVGGVFVCMGYAIRITHRAVTMVSATDSREGEIAAASSTGVKAGLREKWVGGHLRSRPGNMVRQGSGWVVEPESPYLGAPLTGGFGSSVNSPYLNAPGSPYATSPAPPQSGLGLPTSAFGPPSASVSSPPNAKSSFPTAATAGSPYVPSSPAPYSPAPSYGHFPPTPLGSGFAGAPGPSRSPMPGPPRSPMPGPPRSPMPGPPRSPMPGTPGSAAVSPQAVPSVGPDVDPSPPTHRNNVS